MMKAPEGVRSHVLVDSRPVEAAVRSITGYCGSAEVKRSLGRRADVTAGPEQLRQLLLRALEGNQDSLEPAGADPSLNLDSRRTTQSPGATGDRN